MKILIIGALALVLAFPAMAKGGHLGRGHSGSSYRSPTKVKGTGAKSQHEHVSGYTKKSGKQVKGYDRSTKDNTKNNNWSTKGNRNPETGKPGTKKGDGE